ncbi:MAG: DUF3750 domain-containing protein [Alphaproteobacteria bacterium]
MKRFFILSGSVLGLIILLLLGPLGVLASGAASLKGDWSSASDAPMGIAPDPATTPEAVVQVYGARAFKWRGAFGIHTWIAVKPENASAFTIYEVIGWRLRHGDRALAIYQDIPDRRWYGSAPQILADLRGPNAKRAIPKIIRAANAYPYKDRYRVWPGPNSNTFTAHVARQVPALRLDLPPTAIGKDYLGDTTFINTPPSGTGLQVSIFGLAGVIVSPVEGLEINVLGLSFGIDPGELALRLPGIGKLGP